MAQAKPWEQYPYKVFVSYSHDDAVPDGPRKSWGGWLEERLDAFRIPEKLDESATLVVICSPNAARSQYVNDEIVYFKASGRADRVFAFIVDGEPNSGDARECFPQALRHQVDTDGTVLDARAESIAADARPRAGGVRLQKRCGQIKTAAC